MLCKTTMAIHFNNRKNTRYTELYSYLLNQFLGGTGGKFLLGTGGRLFGILDGGRDGTAGLEGTGGRFVGAPSTGRGGGGGGKFGGGWDGGFWSLSLGESLRSPGELCVTGGDGGGDSGARGGILGGLKVGSGKLESLISTFPFGCLELST